MEKLDVWALKNELKAVVKRYSKIDDIILFGLSLSGKRETDVELAIILKQPDPDLEQTLSLSLGDRVKLEILNKEDLYTSKQGYIVTTAGFSLKHDAFLRDMIGLKPKKLFSYSINHLDSSDKRAFNRSLLKTLKKIKAEKIGPGAILIPSDQEGYFLDFLDVWGIKSRTRSWTVL